MTGPLAIAHPERRLAVQTMRMLLLDPALLAVVTVGVLFAAQVAGTAGVVVAAGLAVVAMLGATRSQRLRRWAGARRQLHARRCHAVERANRLHRATTLRAPELAELTRIVEALEDGHASLAVSRLDLPELLDRYVEAAIAQARLIRSAERAQPLLPMAGTDGLPVVDGHSRTLRQEIALRRDAHRDQCLRQAAELELELEAIADFVHLVAEKAASPLQAAQLREEIETRLLALDDLEAAQRQLGQG